MTTKITKGQFLLLLAGWSFWFYEFSFWDFSAKLSDTISIGNFIYCWAGGIFLIILSIGLVGRECLEHKNFFLKNTIGLRKFLGSPLIAKKKEYLFITMDDK